MGRGKGEKQIYRYATYVDGNTVRRTEAVPERNPRRQSEDKQRKERYSKNKQKALTMNGPYVLFLAAAAVVTLYVCVNYLQLQADMSHRISNITAMEKQLDTLTAQNNSLDNTINNYIDLDRIYKVATEELGMVHASEDQVSLYQKTESEYVKQYGDIPSGN